MNTKTYLHIFYQGSGLLDAGSEDLICIGDMLPIYCPAGVEKVMQYHTRVIDAILQLSRLSSLQTVSLLAIRGITFHEFSTVLFDPSIKAVDFAKYPALRAMFLSSDKERKEKLFYSLTRDWNGYKKLLAQMLQPHPLLLSILFGDEG